MAEVGAWLTAFGVADAMADPALTLFEGTTAVASNDNWGGNESVSAAAGVAGAFLVADRQSRDAALYQAGMPAGTYSAHVTSSNTTAGTVLAEIYDASTLPSGAGPGASRLTNVSARTEVGAGGRILIAGFVLAGSSGRTVLIRGIGPGLSEFGVSGVLANPKLELYEGATLLAANDNWGGDVVLRDAAVSVGAFPLAASSSADAALLVTLAPGAYTVQVAGAEGGTGVALVEIYELP